MRLPNHLSETKQCTQCLSYNKPLVTFCYMYASSLTGAKYCPIVIKLMHMIYIKGQQTFLFVPVWLPKENF